LLQLSADLLQNVSGLFDLGVAYGARVRVCGGLRHSLSGRGC
jgi:hypothetical protein